MTVKLSVWQRHLPSRMIFNTTFADMTGSNVPWYESICLAFGASECVTVDYNVLRYDHPRLRTLTPSELEADPEHASRYDVIWSISSYEHDGLGR